MAVLEVLAEMIGPVKLLARVALPKFVHVLKMPDAILPILLVDTGCALVIAATRKFFSTVSTDVGFTGSGRAVVECALIACQCRTRPAVAPNM